ncbi:Tm-1-like ATP-binding domain-containing protein [Pacificibacter marinus]|uniref:Tm-1-like ATP-binding domain-containing protein n=2 Tax=Pacificibacter TaxID=1042323 RepID=UPI001C082883|nr:Tm-1-like ATP-binding domain-containing protein [Pacificibacter marinus]MBU2936373.1 Tm-1-like ATP-binding domain-containing protein [Pacificibacter marinus]MDO6617338.1 Tm-1-like ATP-binding domain-containing protein [Pacificibacter sp. 1_MG-2023]
MSQKAYIVGTADTKGPELSYVRDLIAAAGHETVLVNIGTKGGEDGVDITAAAVAACHPEGPAAVFVNDRGQAVVEMSRALTAFVQGRDDIGGIIGLGGSGGSGIIAPALQALQIGVPKVLVSTLASGDVSAYVGASDVNMFHPVTDVSGLNRISRKLLGNAAYALAGMMAHEAPVVEDDRPALVLSMFGVTTPAVQMITEGLSDRFDCLVFHATGNGGRSMEQLISQGDVSGVLDITTTEICDLLVGGFLSAGEERLDSIAQMKLPYVGSCGALDMANFWGPETVPSHFKGRQFYHHNAQVTLMRATPEESAKIGAWIGAKLNKCDGPVRFLLPLRGVSALDIEGGPFHDVAASEALFGALRNTVVQTSTRQLVELDLHINDPAFAEAAINNFNEIYEWKVN